MQNNKILTTNTKQRQQQRHKYTRTFENVQYITVITVRLNYTLK